MNSTIDFYNNNALKYFEQTFNFSGNEQLLSFEKRLPEKSTVLDLGCGSARDSLYFKKKGHIVTSIDASQELAKIAASILEQPVLCMRAQDISFKEEFDGIWASASLLHIPSDEIDEVLRNCQNALKENGLFFSSFKQGQGSALDQNNRFFQYYSLEDLEQLFKKFFNNVSISKETDKMGREDTTWLSVSCQKPQLKLKYKYK